MLKTEFNEIELLQDWYYSQCNGDWEHEFGIKIDTLDNPGWSVLIHLQNTNLENKFFKDVDIQIDDNNWIQCHVQDGMFKGAGGPKTLAT